MTRVILVLALGLGYLGATAAPSLAHVTASPAFVAQGVETELSIAVPNERAPKSTIGLVVTLPPGIALISAGSPAGWTSEVRGNQATWEGDRISGTDTVRFTMRVRAAAAPGTVTLDAAQRYDDAAAVRWKTSLTIVPGPAASGSSHGRLAVGIGAAVLLVLATLMALQRTRRRVD